MNPTRGKRSRKLLRNIKRKRYIERFQRRYGMTRSEWRELKRSDPQAANAKRQLTCHV